MAARKSMNSILIAAATAALLLVAADARKFIGVNPFCRTASHRLSCTEMVNGATNHHDASVNAVKSTMALAEKLKSLVPTIEPAIAQLNPKAKSTIMESCAKRFDEAIDYLKMSIEAIDAGDVYTAKTYLSAAAADYCKDAVEEFDVGKELPLIRFSRMLNLKVDNCLAVVLQI